MLQCLQKGYYGTQKAFKKIKKEDGMHLSNIKKIILFLLCISTITHTRSSQNHADLIIFSYERPLQLHALLKSIDTYVYNLGTTYVIYRVSNPAHEKAYQEVFDLYPHVIPLKQSNEPRKDFKPLVLKAMHSSPAPYILFSTDDLIMKDYVDVRQCINAINTTDAYGFYLRLGTNITYSYNQNIPLSIPPLNQIEPDIYSWNFSNGKSYWGYPHSLDMVLFKKATIEKDLNTLDYYSPNTLESRWARLADKSKKGLCFKTSKAFNIPLNLVQEDWYNKNEALFTTTKLLDFWNQGLMMDILPFHQITNDSAMMAYTPTFIQRPRTHIPEKKITIIIPSFNNARYYKENIESVLKQNYTNYHIIYIDDASSDNTGKLIEEYIATHRLQDKITLIKNKYNRKALANLYCAVHMCDPEDIILELDGDDALAHTNILRDINRLFSTYDIWLAYAQYKNIPEEKAREIKMTTIGYAKPMPKEMIQSRNFRGKWMWSGLRMFYGWLVQEIKLEDLLLTEAPYKGKFFPTSKDAAIIYPMLEMAGDKCMFIPSLWLMRNVDTPINDFKVARELQKHCGAFLKSLPHYREVREPITSSHLPIDLLCPHPSTDVIIISHNAQRLENYLMSLHIFTMDAKKIYVLYDTNNAATYNALRVAYPHVTFIAHDITCKSQATAFSNAVAQATEYVMITSDTQHLKKALSFAQCIKELERTKASAYYMSLDLKAFGDSALVSTLPCEHLAEDIYAWKYSCFKPHTQKLTAAIYRKENLINSMHSMHNFSLEELADQQYTIQAHKGSVGLFFEHSVIN